jgi:PRTRC genetic system protein E
MFAELKPLLDNCTSITLVLVNGTDDTVNVTVIPKAKDGQNALLSTPLALTGTVAELDAQFAQLVTSYSAKRTSLAEQFEATATILEAAKQESAKSAVTKKKNSSNKSGSTTSCCTGGGDEDNDDDDVLSDGGGVQFKPDALVAPMAPAASVESDLWG